MAWINIGKYHDRTFNFPSVANACLVTELLVALSWWLFRVALCLPRKENLFKDLNLKMAKPTEPVLSATERMLVEKQKMQIKSMRMTQEQLELFR